MNTPTKHQDEAFLPWSLWIACVVAVRDRVLGWPEADSYRVKPIGAVVGVKAVRLVIPLEMSLEYLPIEIRIEGEGKSAFSRLELPTRGGELAILTMGKIERLLRELYVEAEVLFAAA